jgi:hypothetical protein
VPFVHDGVIRFLLLLPLAVVVAAPALHAQTGWSYEDRRDGVHLRVLRNYELPEGATAREPIVVIGGSARIDGRAEDDVVVIGGSVRVGKSAVIRGDVRSFGGNTIIDPGAQVTGSVDSTLIVGPDFDIGVGPVIAGWWPALALGATILRLGLVLVIGILLTLVTPQWIQGLAMRVSSSPIAAGSIGVAGEILFIPSMVAVAAALIMSIVGVLLLLAFPLVLGAAALLWVAGFTAVAIAIGSGLRGRRVDASRPRVFDLLIGFTAITGVTLVAQGMVLSPGWGGSMFWGMRTVGLVIEWLAWTVGLGAGLASLLGGRQALMPPPVPWAAPAPSQS